MNELSSCTYCENFEGEMILVNGNVQRYNFCPICGRPYTSDGIDLLERRRVSVPGEPEQS